MRFKRYQLKGLREEIKRLAEVGRGFNARIQAASGPDRHDLRVEKAGVGYTARVCLLAYGLLRGAPYRSLEPRTRESVTAYLADAVSNAAMSNLPEGGSLPEDFFLDWVSAESRQVQSVAQAAPEAAQ